MDNWLFDGQGIEFHHFQRAKQAQNQAETNRLLREQNDLLRRGEQTPAATHGPQCPQCQTAIEAQGYKPNRCSACGVTLFWSEGLLQPFTTRTQLATHSSAIKSERELRGLLPQLERRIPALEQLVVSLKAGLQAEAKEVLHVVDSVRCLFAPIEACKSTHPHFPVPKRLARVSSVLAELATVLGQHKHLQPNRMYVEATLAESNRLFSTTCEPLPCPAPMPQAVDRVDNADNDRPLVTLIDPSGICQWFAWEVLEVLACIAVADRKLRGSEVTSIASTMTALGVPLSADELTNRIVSTCKQIAKRDTRAVLQTVCDKLQPLRGLPPAAFLIRSAEAVSQAEGVPGDTERDLLALLSASLGGTE